MAGSRDTGSAVIDGDPVQAKRYRIACQGARPERFTYPGLESLFGCLSVYGPVIELTRDDLLAMMLGTPGWERDRQRERKRFSAAAEGLCRLDAGIDQEDEPGWNWRRLDLNHALQESKQRINELDPDRAIQWLLRTPALSVEADYGDGKWLPAEANAQKGQGRGFGSGAGTLMAHLVDHDGKAYPLAHKLVTEKHPGLKTDPHRLANNGRAAIRRHGHCPHC